ncbi:hypothetical protein C1645_881200 [Glomus cerebriforme]|uniref:Uncharacterized protein n=1 Tax=Glomus cerebriforme TaxID=658196 RepID=A0A397SBC5_9GLOM|nr:hypothetical protein C1645_881200 [Glomus cerebriforme]
MKKFNAYWKNNIIDNNIRKVMRDINQLRNKAEWMVQRRNKELRLNIDKDEIDWIKTFNFIMLKNEGSTLETTKNFSQENIKKFIENLRKKNILVNEERWNERITRILLEKSMIKNNQLIIHECIKGIFNKKLLEMESHKEIRKEMERLID